MQVLTPYDAEDCRGLLKAAIRDPDPIIFLENEIMYGESFPVTSHVSSAASGMLCVCVYVYVLLSVLCISASRSERLFVCFCAYRDSISTV
jgi:hypothetical protein